ncbi:MAG: 30S ribosomal protein S4e [Promethearchaeota archaeon]
MGRKGNSHTLKRLNAPAFWRIHKKEFKFTVKPSPGPHPASKSFTLIYIVRDLLKLASNAREAKIILNGGNVLVDGKVRRRVDFPVGLMDVVDIPKINKTYRVVPDRLLYLKLIEIKKDKEFKLCKIKNKTTVKGGSIQLNLHDGRNVLIYVADPRDPKEDVYKVNDVIKVNLKTREIKDHIKFEVGKFAIVHDGVNNGRFGKIVQKKIQFGPNASTVTLDDKGETFDTALNFVMVLGYEKPVINLGI